MFISDRLRSEIMKKGKGLVRRVERENSER
jgi:hypothetical protein